MNFKISFNGVTVGNLLGRLVLFGFWLLGVYSNRRLKCTKPTSVLVPTLKCRKNVMRSLCIRRRKEHEFTTERVWLAFYITNMCALGFQKGHLFILVTIVLTSYVACIQFNVYQFWDYVSAIKWLQNCLICTISDWPTICKTQIHDLWVYSQSD